jgi:type III secretion protein R
MTKNASEHQKERFFELARKTRSGADRASVTKEDFSVVVPAFLVTELVEAFMLGFAIFLPFLVVDLVVANVLLSLGMQSLSPTQVSLPFKLLLFVAADGWTLLAQALVTGYSN